MAASSRPPRFLLAPDPFKSEIDVKRLSEDAMVVYQAMSADSRLYSNIWLNETVPRAYMDRTAGNERLVIAHHNGLPVKISHKINGALNARFPYRVKVTCGRNANNAPKEFHFSDFDGRKDELVFTDDIFDCKRWFDPVVYKALGLKKADMQDLYINHLVRCWRYMFPGAILKTKNDNATQVTGSTTATPRKQKVDYTSPEQSRGKKRKGKARQVHDLPQNRDEDDEDVEDDEVGPRDELLYAKHYVESDRELWLSFDKGPHRFDLENDRLVELLQRGYVDHYAAGTHTGPDRAVLQEAQQESLESRVTISMTRALKHWAAKRCSGTLGDFNMVKYPSLYQREQNAKKAAAAAEKAGNGPSVSRHSNGQIVFKETNATRAFFDRYNNQSAQKEGEVVPERVVTKKHDQQSEANELHNDRKGSEDDQIDTPRIEDSAQNDYEEVDGLGPEGATLENEHAADHPADSDDRAIGDYPENDYDEGFGGDEPEVEGENEGADGGEGGAASGVEDEVHDGDEDEDEDESELGPSPVRRPRREYRALTPEELV